MRNDAVMNFTWWNDVGLANADEAPFFRKDDYTLRTSMALL
jgi:hypothetical protein